jgi:tungstate transport system ATP-binding protein
MDRPLYQIDFLRHVYDGRTVLEIDHLNVPEASIIGLVGPNGSGKSTLLKLLGLIESPTQGTLRFNNRLIKPFSEEARFQISLLPQQPFLLKRSVFGNVAYGLKLRGQRDNLVKAVDEALTRVGLDPGRFRRRPWNALSGGEAQRVALAARLALRPKLLLMDEPTANVDAFSAQLIKDASLNARRNWGTTLVVASHDRQWLSEICDEVLHLFKGRMIVTKGETIVFGPWQKGDNGFWKKPLGSDQELVTPPPPAPDAAAVVEVMPMDSRNGGEKGVRSLEGTVTTLNLERCSGKVLATVLVGHLGFYAPLNQGALEAMGIFPGSRTSIFYRPERIRWI